MPLISGSLDFALSIVCFSIAMWGMRQRNDFLFTGFLWVATAAFVGAFNLAGMTQVNPTHHYLSQISTGIGSLAMGLGVWAASWGPLPGSRWGAIALSIIGAGVIHVLSDWQSLGLLNLLLGSTLLVSLLLSSVQAIRRGCPNAALSGLAAISVLLFVGFVMPQWKLPAEGLMFRDNVLHILLITCYSFLWLSVRGVTAEHREKLIDP